MSEEFDNKQMVENFRKEASHKVKRTEMVEKRILEQQVKDRFYEDHCKSKPNIKPIKRYVRMNEAMEIYSIRKDKMRYLAEDAGAVYKIGKTVLINTEIFEAYLQTFRIEPMDY